MLRIYNGQIATDDGFIQQDLWCEKGKIIPPASRPDHSIDAQGKIVAPGYIDLQINGGYGVDLTANPENVGILARKLPAHGITSFLPTIVSTGTKEYRRAIKMLQPRPVSQGATILGVHLEGPCFNSQFSGAHQKNIVPQFNKEARLEDFYGPLVGVKIITLAPEMPLLLEVLSNTDTRSLLLSIGHSNASLSCIKEAIEHGAQMVTHLFNAMPSFHHRRPSLIDAALIEKNLDYSIICDGVHVDKQAIQMAWKLNPKGLILVSDATEAMGMPPGSYKLANEPIQSDKNAAYLSGSKVLCGSIKALDHAVCTLHTFTNCPLHEALAAATLRPAKRLGIEHIKGSLSIGNDADFIFLDKALNVLETYIGGQRVY